MELWYDQYWSQTWYKNTFLVRRPNQIGRTVERRPEWNNIDDSGCNFVCLAMIIGIDPARLASMLSEQHFFAADRTVPAQRPTGGKGGLVWDQSEPSARLRTVKLRNVWHPVIQKRTTLEIRFVDKTTTSNYLIAYRVISKAHQDGQHVILGPEDHSYLVAGIDKHDYIIWDPDESQIRVEETIAGKLKLNDLWDEYRDASIEICTYSVRMR